MLRLTSTLLLLCGSVLLVTWAVGPAESQPPRGAPIQLSRNAEVPAELAEVNAEVERLAVRLDRAAAFAMPARDPFSFVSRSRAVRELPGPEVVPLAPVESIPPAWPTLVGILSDAADGRLQVALSDHADDLHVVSAGESVGAFVVSEISVDVVVVSDPATGLSTRLSVR